MKLLKAGFGLSRCFPGQVCVVQVADANTEAFLDGKSVAVASGLSSPHDVAIALDGSVWIADANNDRLVQMTPALNVLRTIQGVGYDFDGPRYLDSDAGGRLYVADKYSHTIKVLGLNADLVFTLGSGRGEFGPGKFDRPEGVAIQGADIWFSDTYNDRLVRYPSTEKLLSRLISRFRE